MTMERSPQPYVRLAGLLYLAIIALGLFGEAFVRGPLVIAGLSYLINSFALFLAPKLAAALFPAILLPAFVGELAFAAWLTFKGVDLERWRMATR